MLETQRLNIDRMTVTAGTNNAIRSPPYKASAGVQRVNTVAGVTAEAREVLEQFLRRSLSDVNQRGRPGNYLRQPLAAIAEQDRISVEMDQHEANLRDHNEGGRASMSAQKLQLNGNGLIDVNRNLSIEDERRWTVSGKVGNVHDPDMHNSSKAPKRMLAEEEVTDLTDIDEDLENDLPKKKKSIFKRARERLQATFRRQSEEKESTKKDKEILHGSSRKQGLFASFRRKPSLKRTSLKAESDSHSAFVRTNYAGGDSKNQKRDKRKSDSVVGSDSVKAKNPFASLQRRISSIRVKRSQSKDSSSASVEDAINLTALSDHQRELLEKHCSSDKPLSDRHTTAEINGDVSLSANSLVHVSSSGQGHHSLRSKLQLNGLQSAQPASGTTDSQLYAPISADSWDYIDGVAEASSRVSLPPLTRSTEKPFHEKSPGEKEELFERVALQLAEIGDLYKFGSPVDGNFDVKNAVAQSASTQPAASAVTDSNTNATLTSRSNEIVTTLVSDLLRNANYGNFQRVVSDAVAGESGLQQIALVFHATKAAMQLVGTGTTQASRIKDMTLKYFEENLASWIIQKGGWASVVEDSTTTDSELD